MKNKPVVNTSSTYNINNLPSDRRFEELLHRIFEYRIKNDKSGVFDSAHLMPGVAEKGVDVLLQLNGKSAGAIQCKMNTSGNLNKPVAAKEIIKFVINYLQDNILIDDIVTFQYYLVVSGKFAASTTRLLGDFKNNILNEPDFKKWTESVLKEYSAFKTLNYRTIELELKGVVSKLNVKVKSYSELNNWLNEYPKVADEFFEIKKVVDNSVIENGLTDIKEILDPNIEGKVKKVISDYYKSVKAHLDVVKFIGHDIQQRNRPRNITVSKLYIEPHFQFRKSLKSNGKDIEEFRRINSKELRIHNVFEKANNYIILGDPGAGKSLMVKNLILRFVKSDLKIGGLKKYKGTIPFRIELRKYNEIKNKAEINIMSYLTSLLKTEYQLSHVEDEVIEYLVQNRNTVFFFDGLDEIFDLTQKNNVRDDIVNFITVNSGVKCVITSRFRGYHDICFPENIFQEFEIQNFNDKQVERFVEKFYATQVSNRQDRDREISSCKKQLRQVDENLKTNPLILSLMSLLAINKIVIPDSKLEVYRSITNTLVETRDKDEKNLHINLKVKSKRGTLGYLAFWQYTQMSNKKRVSRKLAEDSIAKYLLRLKSDPIEDIYEADDAAKNFLDYTEKRSIYFDDNFTHKTFLEYYTADYLFTKFHNGGKHIERDKVISKYIHNTAWHIVFELLISMIDEGLVDSDILDDLINTHINEVGHEAVYFFLSLLEATTNIGVVTKKKIIKSALNLILKGKQVADSEAHMVHDQKDLFSLFQKISMIDGYRNLIQEIIFDYEKKKVSRSYKINFYIFIEELNLDMNHGDQDRNRFVKYKINNKADFGLLKDSDLLLFLHYYLSNDNFEKVDFIPIIIEQANKFNIESLFNYTRYKFHVRVSKLSTFELFLWQNKFDSIENLRNEISLFESSGITLDLIMKHFKIQNSVVFMMKENNNLENAINLYIENEGKKVNDFLYYLLSNLDNRSLSKFDKYIDNPKFIKLMAKS